MKAHELSNLKPGDLIRHKSKAEAYVVTAHHGYFVIAVRTTTASCAEEWDIVDQGGNVISHD